MEYYSQFNMPSIEERKKDLLDYANKLTNIIEYTPEELDKIATKIVNETEKYSYTGYSVFGKKQEQTKILNILNKNQNNSTNISTTNTFK